MGNQTSRWDRFSPALLAERAQFAQHYPDGEIVYVHGDLNEDNLLFDEQGGIRLIDFADGLLAPVVYEHALIASELFRFDVPFLNGFFGDFNLKQLTELCLSGLLLHDFGGNILQDLLGDVSDIFSLDDMRDRLCRHIRIELEKK